MTPRGPIRRESLVEKVANAFTAEHDLGPRERAVVMGAVRIGIIEAVRGCMYMPNISPSAKLAMETHWGMSGTRHPLLWELECRERAMAAQVYPDLWPPKGLGK